MVFVQSPTEITTAITDLALTLVSLAAILWLSAAKTDQLVKRRLWVGMLALLAVSGLLGASAHGLVMSDQTHENLWRVLNLLLILLISCFGIAAILDWLGRLWMLGLGLPILGLGLAVYASLYLFEGTFLMVMLYEVAVMVLALGVYLYLSWCRRSMGWWSITAGLAVTILAAGVQTQEGMILRLVWEFDHNGIFHLIQMLGILFLVKGVVMTLKESER